MSHGRQEEASNRPRRLHVSPEKKLPHDHSTAWLSTIRLAALVAFSSLSLCVSGALAEANQTQATHASASTESAKKVIHDAIERALRILRDQNLKNDSASRMKTLRAELDPVFDWEAMARSSLGPPWRSLNDSQRAEFVAVFKELLARRYMDDIDRFQGSEELRVTGSEQRGEQVIVRTMLITVSREEVPIDYTMHSPEGRFVVEDISIEGISMVNHYRKTFSRFLVNDDFDSLLQRLKRKLGTS